MPSSPAFATTRWTLVLRAAGRNSDQRDAALAELLAAYWRPLYGFLRRRGHSTAEAEDLLQGFLARLLEKDSLNSANAARGRFRSFLLACLQNYLANERTRAAARKRGGDRRKFSIDAAAAERCGAFDPAHEATAERLFERDWALELIQRTLARVAEAWRRQDRAQAFDVLRQYLLSAEEPPSYAAAAQAMAMTEGAVKTAVHRLRAQFRQYLCEEVAATLDRDELLEDEVRRLFSALSV